MNSIVDAERTKNKVFAEENGLSLQMIEEEAEKIYNELNPNDFDSDESRMIRALRRSRGAFRKQAQQMGKAEEGMIVFRFRDYSFDRDQYNIAKSKELKDGREAAIEEGYMNEEGQPLYRFGMNKGKVIAKPNANGSAVGYLNKEDKDGEEIIETRYIAIGDRVVNDTIPVCQVGRIAGSIGQKRNPNFVYSDKNMFWYNASAIDDFHRAPYSREDIAVILRDWDEAFTDKDGENLVPKLKSYEELMDFAEDHCQRKSQDDYQFDFCFIPGIISEISVPDNEFDNVYVTIEFTDYDTNEVSFIGTFIPQGHLKGLSMSEGSIGICALQAYNFKDDDSPIRWHLGGFLNAKDNVAIEEFFGVVHEDVQ